MSKGGEQLLARKITAWLEAEQVARRLWYVKIHGGPYQRAGVWDWVVCVNGLFGAIEAKNPNGSNELSPAQHQQGRLLEAAGAGLCVARDLQTVQGFVRKMGQAT